MISILLIDDEIKWMKSLQRTLTQNGITDYELIHMAQNRDEALEILADRKVDLVFLDLNMGGGIRRRSSESNQTALS